MSERDEFLTGGMVPVWCDCGNRVLVRKNSPQHTSVQWLSDTSACPELRGSRSALVPSCLRLRDGIEKAARDGVLEVADG
ncbi:hypothetical protein SAMN05216188_12772 [Lentzea xinjiangensis]|uniref:Ferredoxin n=1 Tax=Lentzea xinjiangensis TaxID=402600 RepID=A0A1H9VP46_9PSEU|nr:hypothetical protein [Lentzea xinjiangensis]SES23560.1 hypothetical protein SAMN05216188_12772 [Lentzea xinjiangensis]